jgi:hypothetical protein
MIGIVNRIRTLALTALVACGHDANAPADSGALAGTWRDAIGDAPWQTIELTARDATHGAFVGHRWCATPPCEPPIRGDYDYEPGARALRVHVAALEGQAFVVHLGGDVMEWRQHDVAIRRFTRVPPPPPATPSLGDFPAKDAARPAGAACDALTAQGCLWSPDCVLVPTKSGPYLCRVADGPCEHGVAEADPMFLSDCTGRTANGAHCSVRSASCFCPNARTKVAPPQGSAEAAWASVACACGGGPPQECTIAP